MEIQNELQYHVRTFKRRKMLFIVPAVAAMLVCTLVALFLPSTYESTGVILIEAQDVPEDLVQSTITGLVEERLQSLNQVVLSRSNLLNMIKEFDLYKAERKRLSTSELIELMRDSISVEMVTTEVHDAEAARSGVATYAFTLSYEGREPKKVLQVCNQLVTLYLNENIKSREGKTRSTYQYLDSRMGGLDEEIKEVEERIKVFKEENQYLLPELAPMTLRALEFTEGQMRFKKQEMERALARTRYWSSELAARPQFIIVRTTGGVRLITPEEELDRMRRDYVALLATHAESHPDATKLKKEMDALEEQVKFRSDVEEFQNELERKENELKLSREKYTDNHPDVVRLMKEVQTLQDEIGSMSDEYLIKPKDKEMELNPQWVLAKNQRDTHMQDLEKLTNEYNEMVEQVQELEARMSQAPQVELEYSTLLNELQTLTSEREGLTQRTLAAKEAKGLEESGLGEKFTLIDPPLLPEEPSKPNRALLLGLGLILSSALGVAFGATAEFLDRSLHTSEELANYTGYPVLTVVPFMGEDIQPGGVSTQKTVRLVVLATTIIVGLITVHYVVYRLDLLWEKILLKLGLF